MKPNRATWLDIDLSAVHNNVRQLRRLIRPDCKIMGVIKANAYGHGAIPIAKAILQEGVEQLAVATLGEAIELREADITAPILILGFTPLNQLENAAELDLSLTIYDAQSAEALNAAAGRRSKQAKVHIKVNTGMNRLGLPIAETAKFLSKFQNFQNLNAEGIYTHFATADEAEQEHTLAQFSQFKKLINELKENDICPAIVHTANSAATIALPETHFDMVRPGIALYGLHPDPQSCRLPSGFRPALTWKAEVTHINYLQKGDAVSYGREYVATEQSAIAVLPVGYADGFPRKPQHWKYVLVNGRPAPIVGRVCMDQTMIDISHHLSVSEDAIAKGGSQQQSVAQGDEVVLIGSQRDASLTAEDVAIQIGTNNYDVVSRILSRVPRIYSES